MSLTTYRAPLGSDPTGTFGPTLDVPDHVVWIEPSHRWIRGDLGDVTIVDTKRTLAVHESDRFLTYYFPVEDVRMDLLAETGRRASDDPLGRRTYYGLRVDGVDDPRAAWAYEDTTEAGKPLEGFIAFRWDALDRWREEDDELFIHPRDPYHRVDALPTSRHVVVRVDGEIVAESGRGVALFETGLPTRFYLPREDVNPAFLRDSDSETGCPYKGWASYHHVQVGDSVHEDLVWYYDDPRHEVAPIAGLLAFYNEKVDLEVDGEALERPITKFS